MKPVVKKYLMRARKSAGVGAFCPCFHKFSLLLEWIRSRRFQSQKKKVIASRKTI
jgi:hypothetical protein